jgi:hypothetical protein
MSTIRSFRELCSRLDRPRENYFFPIESRRDGLRVAQDVVLGRDSRDRPVPQGRLKTRLRCSAVPRGTAQLVDHFSDSFGLGTMVAAGWPGPSISSASPFIPSLNPRRPAPSPLPSSGSLFPPKSMRAMAATSIRCVGVSSSPILFLPWP